MLVYPGPTDTVPVFLEAVQALRAGFEPPFPIALDVDMQVVKELDIAATLAKPTTIVLDEKGIIRYAFIGRQPANRPSVRDILGVVDGLP